MYKKIKLVIVDDGSTDDTAFRVRQEWPDSILVSGCGDLWWAGGLQAGIDRLKRENLDDNDLVLLSNDDIAFDSSFLEMAVRKLKGRHRVLYLPTGIDKQTGEILPGERGIYYDQKTLTFQDTTRPEMVNCLSTRALFLKWCDICSLGGFRPAWLPHYLSDYEFTIRAYRQGFSLVVDDSNLVAIDRSTTGVHSLRAHSRFIDKLRFIFSRRYSSNPYYLTVFAFLTCPLSLALRHLVLIWWGCFISFFKWGWRRRRNFEFSREGMR